MSKQVYGIFNEFFKKYPSVVKLANARQEELEETVGGLGPRKRASYLIEIARTVVERFGGVIPRDPSVLMSLKGVGRCTANAVLSFAYHECVPVIDSNVARVLRRFFCIEGKSPHTQTKIYGLLPKELCPAKNAECLTMES